MSGARNGPKPGYEAPPGWLVEKRARLNEKYLGKVDRYYYEPETNRQFKSFKKAMERYNESLQEPPVTLETTKMTKGEECHEFDQLDPERVEWVRRRLAEGRKDLMDAFK